MPSSWAWCNSNFENASGYPIANHYTTAHDIAILSRALIHDFPEDYAISAVKQFEWNGIKQGNRNTLLWRDPSVDGIKTGHTAAAGYCLAASAKQGDSRMIAIVMGASSEKARADSAHGAAQLRLPFLRNPQPLRSRQAAGHAAAVEGRRTTPCRWASPTPVQVTVKRGDYDKLKATMDVPATLIAPFKKGQQVGTLRVTLDGQPVQSVPLVALADAPQGGFFSRLWDSIMLWFHSDGDKKADADAK